MRPAVCTRRDARALHDTRLPGARARSVAVQARYPVADERRHGAGLRSDLVSELADTSRPAVTRGLRLRQRTDD